MEKYAPGDQVEFDHHGKRLVGVVTMVARTDDSLMQIRLEQDPEGSRQRWFIRLASEVRHAGKSHKSD